MSKAVVIFKAIDHMFAGPQNPGKLKRAGKKEVDLTKDIAYGEGEFQKLDLYRKKDATGKTPVIIEIHGGGFVAGDKKYRTALCYWYCINTGATVISLNYSLGPKYIYPVAQQELANAMNFIGDHADEWGIDLSKSIVTGDSAGGWASAQLCAMQDSDYMQEKLGVKLKYKVTGAVLNCGIYDLQKAVSAKVLFNLTESVCKDFTGITVKELPEWQWLDVVDSKNYVTANWPTSFIVYAEQDFFCGGQGEALVEKLDELGVYQEHYASKKFGDNHTFSLTWTSKAAKECNAQILSFLNRFFAGEIKKAD